MGLLGHILSLRAGVSFDQLVKDRTTNLRIGSFQSGAEKALI
jgi:hypothetical protein